MSKVRKTAKKNNPSNIAAGNASDSRGVPLVETDAKNSELRWQLHFSAGRKAINAGNLEDAVKEFQSDLRFAERLNDYRVANTLAELGFVSLKLNEFRLARYFIKQALETRETTYGARDASVAIEYNNLAMTYQWGNDDLEAKALLEKSVEILNTHEELTALNYAEPYENLADICKRQGNFIRAEELCKQALSIRERAARRLHPSSMRALEHLKQIQLFAGKQEKAAETRDEYENRLKEYAENRSFGATAKMLRRLLDYREGSIDKSKAESSISEFLKLMAAR